LFHDYEPVCVDSPVRRAISVLERLPYLRISERTKTLIVKFDTGLVLYRGSQSTVLGKISGAGGSRIFFGSALLAGGLDVAGGRLQPTASGRKRGLILPADEKVEVAECSVNNKSSRFI